MSRLSESFTFKSLSLRNRVVMPPMCQYSAEGDGKPTQWHDTHYISRAVGGAGLIIMEMTDVEPDGRITDYCLGLWSDGQVPAFARVIEGMHRYGAKVGIQIAHAGRKAEDADTPVGPTDKPFSGAYKKPRALTTEEARGMAAKFAAAAGRAVQAGADTIELHGAHGYLIHQFHSPSINTRDDEYGRDLPRFGVEVVQAVKAQIPADMPLIMRLSAVEYIDGGYDLDYALELARQYRDAGVDMFHVSSGGEGPAGQRKPGNHPGYQVDFARRFREELGMPVIAVGHLDDPALAESVVAGGDADLVAVGRGMLNDPYWAAHAIRSTGGNWKETLPRQYDRIV